MATKDQKQDTQKLLEPAQQQAEVEAGGGEHGVDAVAISAFEIIATHPMIVLEMADHGLDGGATRISRRMALVTRRTWPLIQTLNRSG